MGEDNIVIFHFDVIDQIGSGKGVRNVATNPGKMPEETDIDGPKTMIEPDMDVISSKVGRKMTTLESQKDIIDTIGESLGRISISQENNSNETNKSSHQN